jgi:signal transduction histidine kinase
LTESLKRALEGEQVSYEANYEHEHNGSTYYSIRIFPVYRHGAIEGVMLVGSDITEKKLLEKKLLEAKVQEQKKIIRAVLNAQEVATNKIGQELHDNVNQILSSIRLYISMIEEDNTVRKNIVEKIKESIDLAISEIRQLGREHVTPPPKFILKEVIEDLVNSFNENNGLKTKFSCTIAENLNVEEELKLNVYRIVQEQTNNIIKYANASIATIVVKEQNALLHILISDDGQGCDLATRRKGIGISNIINRVKSYNGDIMVESSPGEGFQIKIGIPLAVREVL